ncbi:protein phosphatase 2C domain-containing protein [Okeania sp.]|uniref:protein phosphatase 2C domain-containing protein n=1 Tax=Okeania sp. TaxID=3100323 RepID=UPI002B4B28EB|nr:protein phosphatase 2C domain-containing protein [Okeania sp.]MEB3339794.1 protein phosphatase 2C domain-containing protein [Okeania sp.]
MPKHYLWAIGEGIKTYRPGQIIADRYQVEQSKILLDTQPQKMPEMPQEIPGKIRPYLKLFSYRLHIPQVFGLVSLPSNQKAKKIWLLEGGPINLETASLMPQITTVWANATPMRQLNWLWQIAQLWQPLIVQQVGSSLLNPENLRVEGQLVRLLELQPDKKPVTLQHLGRLWQKWVKNAQPGVAKFLKQLSEQMMTGEVENADLLITQLDNALQALGRSQVRSIHITTATDTGPSRDHNEDACFPPSKTLISYPPSSNTVAIVCDGVGGQDGGERASQLAIQVLSEQLEKIPKNEDSVTISTKLEEFVCMANDAICDQNDNEQRQGRQRMGTTLVMALANLHELYISHIGDSRAYWITPNRCYQVTVDDDIASRQVRLGYSLYNDAIQQVASGALTQALGITNSMSLYPTVQRFPIDEDSIFLICSDGLSDKNRVEECWQTEILPLFYGKVDLATVRDRLIKIANSKNGHDNVTVGLLHYRVTARSQATELSLPPIEIKSAQLKKLSIESKNQTVMFDLESKNRWFYLLGIFILLGLGGVLVFLLSPIVKDLIEVIAPRQNISDNVENRKEKPDFLPSPTSTSSKSLSLDVNSFILIGDRNSSANKLNLNKPIKLRTNTRGNIIKGIVSQGSILKVTRKIIQSEEAWLELEVCSVTESLNSEQEVIDYLQPKDRGWIQKLNIESRLDIVNYFDGNSEQYGNSEQLGECAIDFLQR